MVKDVTKYNLTELEILSCADHDEYTPGYIVNQTEEWWAEYQDELLMLLDKLYSIKHCQLVWNPRGGVFTARLLFDEAIRSEVLLEDVVAELHEFLAHRPIM